jgi:ankyrin repeat protein
MSNQDADESVKIATLLLDVGSDVSAVDVERVSVLMFAAKYTCPQMVSLLIARGAKCARK